MKEDEATQGFGQGGPPPPPDPDDKKGKPKE